MKNQPPYIGWNMHEVLKLLLQRDARGNVNVRQLRHKEKNVTHKETEAFKFSKWNDLTRDVQSFLDTDVVRVGFHHRKNTK